MKEVVFLCKLCGAKHPTVELLDCGVAKLPPTITTEQNSNREWYFKCVQCKKLPTP